MTNHLLPFFLGGIAYAVLRALVVTVLNLALPPIEQYLADRRFRLAVASGALRVRVFDNGVEVPSKENR